MFIYFFWLSLTSIISILGIINFFPTSKDEMFPLFQDITILLLFLPSYFIIFFGIIPHLILCFISSPLLRRSVIFSLLIIAYTYSLVFFNFYSIEIRLITSLFFAGTGFVYFNITNILKQRINKTTD